MKALVFAITVTDKSVLFLSLATNMKYLNKQASINNSGVTESEHKMPFIAAINKNKTYAKIT
jgi:hypothetical protein